MLRKSVLIFIVLVAVAAICILFVGRVRLDRQVVKSCFADVRGPKSGAVVRLAGVDVGRVRSVHAEPQNKNCPAEVEMDIATSYELSIPKDALTDVETAGVLGERFVSIDVSQSSGATIENYGYLKSKPAKRQLSFEEDLRAARALVELEAAERASEKASTAKTPAMSQNSKP